MNCKILLIITVLMAGPVVGEAFSDGGSVFLFDGCRQFVSLDDVEARDAQNRIITNSRSIEQLHSLFVINLYQTLLSRSAGVMLLITSSALKPFSDFASFRRSRAGDVLSLSDVAAVIFQKFEKIIVSLVFLSVPLASLSKIFTANYRQPPVVYQTFEVLRC